MDRGFQHEDQLQMQRDVPASTAKPSAFSPRSERKQDGKEAGVYSFAPASTLKLSTFTSIFLLGQSRTYH